MLFVTQLIRISPFPQFETDLAIFNQFLADVAKHCVDGQPPHVASPNSSSIAVLSDRDFLKMSASEVQGILRHKNIAITDRPVKPFIFDEQGLRELKDLTARVDVQGLYPYSL